jgi:hypothetical protein
MCALGKPTRERHHLLELDSGPLNGPLCTGCNNQGEGIGIRHKISFTITITVNRTAAYELTSQRQAYFRGDQKNISTFKFKKLHFSGALISTLGRDLQFSLSTDDDMTILLMHVSRRHDCEQGFFNSFPT